MTGRVDAMDHGSMRLVFVLSVALAGCSVSLSTSTARPADLTDADASVDAGDASAEATGPVATPEEPATTIPCGLEMWACNVFHDGGAAACEPGVTGATIVVDAGQFLAVCIR